MRSTKGRSLGSWSQGFQWFLSPPLLSPGAGCSGRVRTCTHRCSQGSRQLPGCWHEEGAISRAWATPGGHPSAPREPAGERGWVPVPQNSRLCDWEQPLFPGCRAWPLSCPACRWSGLASGAALTCSQLGHRAGLRSTSGRRFESKEQPKGRGEVMGNAPAASVPVPALWGATAHPCSLLPGLSIPGLLGAQPQTLQLAAAPEPVSACTSSPLQAGENKLDAGAGFRLLLGQPADRGSGRKGMEWEREQAQAPHPCPCHG